MSSAVALSTPSFPTQATTPAPSQLKQRQGFDLEDQLVKSDTKKVPWKHCTQEFGTRLGVLPRMPVDPVIGPVGANSSACGGALVGAVIGTIIWAPLGITALAVTSHPYHSVVRGVLFLALGIPGFTAIGALLGGCLGSGESKEV